MSHSPRVFTGLVLLLLPVRVSAGLYYSGEVYAELPSQWRGFLLDQRALRQIAVPPGPKVEASPSRLHYQQQAATLEKKAAQSKLSAAELADLGAIHVRLGDVTKALTVLRGAQREHPNHFHIAANLGTVWQLYGDLEQAALCLEQAVRLAPGKYQKAEEYHLKLVRQRLARGPKDRDLDDLFGVKYVGEGGDYEPGKMAAGEKKKLPASALAVAQQLGLWLPADGRLLWQLAELANAHGDVRMAAAMMDGCVTQFGMGQPELRRRRQILRHAADKLAQGIGPASGFGQAKKEHEEHAGGFAARSKRPLAVNLVKLDLPPIRGDGVNPLAWEVVNETVVDARFRPTFPNYLKELEGKQVTLTGFMQPLSDDLDLSAFLFIEYPVGCWYCEMPAVTSMVWVELAPGQTTTFQRSLLRVTGRFHLNANDPEDFLYHIRQAKAGGVD